MEIILNKCYGGYGLSDEAVRLYLTKKNIPIVLNPAYASKYFKYYIVGDDERFSDSSISRTDPI